MPLIHDDFLERQMLIQIYFLFLIVDFWHKKRFSCINIFIYLIFISSSAERNIFFMLVFMLFPYALKTLSKYL